MTRMRSNLDLCRFLIRSINRVVADQNYTIVLSEVKKKEDGEEYRDLVWHKRYDDVETEELIFGGDDFELFCVLTGIQYGIRMQRGDE